MAEQSKTISSVSLEGRWVRARRPSSRSARRVIKSMAGIPGAFPALDGSAVVNGPLQAHLTFVIHGSPRNPIMRPFGKEMSDRQLAGVLTYERNAWSNHTGDLVTPEQGKAAR